MNRADGDDNESEFVRVMDDDNVSSGSYVNRIGSEYSKAGTQPNSTHNGAMIQQQKFLNSTTNQGALNSNFNGQDGIRMSGQLSEFNRGKEFSEYENSFPQDKAGLTGMMPDEGRGSSYYQGGVENLRVE